MAIEMAGPFATLMVHQVNHIADLAMASDAAFRPEELEQLLKSDIAKWSAVIKAVEIKIN